MSTWMEDDRFVQLWRIPSTSPSDGSISAPRYAQSESLRLPGFCTAYYRPVTRLDKGAMRTKAGGTET